MTGFRDPALVYERGWFYLFFTYVLTRVDGVAYSTVAWAKSRNLRRWTKPHMLTPQNKGLEYGSPGSVVRFGGRWVMCLQTYPRPHGERYGNQDSRLWTMRSDDLEHWDAPEMLMVKGPKVAVAAMGRMIDPVIFRDKDDAAKWWCFFKQNGVSRSWSRDLKTWTFAGTTEAGENTCVVVDGDEYVLFHSPPNGIGVKRSKDLVQWRDAGVLTLGQRGWPWAEGRITAGFVLDLRKDPAYRKALMVFHGSRYPEIDPRGGFDNFASIGLAWSDDLIHWDWPGR